MSEFVFEGRDHTARNESPFVLGFIEAMFFTECGHVPASEWLNVDPDEKAIDGELPADVGYIDLSPESLAAIRAECETWQSENESLLALAYGRDYEAIQAGRDYWFTRNGHGVGFWDRECLTDMSDIGDRLAKACENKPVHVWYDAPFVHVEFD